MMRSKFDEQLFILNNELIKMGALCEEAIALATKTLLEGDLSLMPKVFAADHEIDQKERDIEALCIRLLLQQQPVARDLRLISSAMKMIYDMERIGDQASDITEIVKFVNPSEVFNRVHIGDMAVATIKMVTESVNSFVNRDLELAKAVIKSDDIVDGLFIKVKKELINLISEGNALEKGESCIDLLMTAKYFERIGDHATNIAEWVVYSITGSYKGESL